MRFFGKKEKNAFEILQEACKRLKEMGAGCERLISAFFEEGDLKHAEGIGDEIMNLESRADEDRRTFIQKLYDGAFHPTWRGDLVDLAERLDKVADSIEDVASLLLLREKLFRKLGGKRRQVGKGLKKLAKTCTQTVQALTEAIEFLRSDLHRAVLKTHEVQELEKKADLLENEFRASLEALESKLDPLSIIQLGEIAQKLGEICDVAEDTGDVILRFASGLRG